MSTIGLVLIILVVAEVICLIIGQVLGYWQLLLREVKFELKRYAKDRENTSGELALALKTAFDKGIYTTMTY